MIGIKKIGITSIGEEREELKSSFISKENIKWSSFFEKILAVSQKN